MVSNINLIAFISIVALTTSTMGVLVFLGYLSIEKFLYFISLLGVSLLLKSLIRKINLYSKKLKNYKRFISIYEALLTSTDECWIALNQSGVIIGFSEKVKALFDSKEEIKRETLANCLIEEHAEILKARIDDLIEKGENFKIVCNGKHSMRSLIILGSRFTIKGTLTNCIWIKDLSDFVNEKNVINQQLRNTLEDKKALEYLIDNIGVPLWVRNKDMQLEFCNKTYEEIVEKEKSEILIKNIPLVKGAAFGEGDSLARNASKTDKPQKILQNIIVRGERKKYEINETPNKDGKIVGFGVDKTAEFNSMRELDRYIKAHGDVLEMLSAAVAIFNVETRLVFFNTAYKNLTTIEEGWLHTSPKFSKVLDEMRRRRKLPEVVDFSKYKKEKLDIFTSISSVVQELEYLPDGRALRVIASPYPLGGVIFMYEDVSDNLDLQRQHNTLLEVQRETINNLYEGVAVYASDNRIKLFNPALKKIWNIDESVNLFGMHINDVMEYMKNYMSYGDDWVRYKESAIANLTDRIPKTGRMFRQNDTVVNFSYLPLPDGSHVHSYIDVTASWVVEKALYEKNNALEEAEHIKSQFISNISTELSCALKKIVSVSKDIDPVKVPDINKILNCTNELYTLISDLTDLASIEAGTIDINNDLINVYNFLSNITDIFVRRFYNKEIKLNFDIDKNINIIGDEKRLRQVILNILNISFKKEFENKLEISVTMSEWYVKINIKNVDLQWNNKSSKDIKLLPVIKGIIELHGGKIVPVESNNFAFVLPVSEASALSDAAKDKVTEVI